MDKIPRPLMFGTLCALQAGRLDFAHVLILSFVRLLCLEPLAWARKPPVAGRGCPVLFDLNGHHSLGFNPNY